MNEHEQAEYDRRQLLAQGIRLAFMRIKGTSKLDKCAKLGVTNYALDKWTSGVSQPSEEKLARLARVSGMDQETIRLGGSNPNEDENNERN